MLKGQCQIENELFSNQGVASQTGFYRDSIKKKVWRFIAQAVALGIIIGARTGFDHFCDHPSQSYFFLNGVLTI